MGEHTWLPLLVAMAAVSFAVLLLCGGPLHRALDELVGLQPKGRGRGRAQVQVRGRVRR